MGARNLEECFAAADLAAATVSAGRSSEDAAEARRRLFPVALDVQHPESVAGALQHLRTGGVLLDVMVCNAGVFFKVCASAYLHCACLCLWL